MKYRIDQKKEEVKLKVKLNKSVILKIYMLNSYHLKVELKRKNNLNYDVI